MNNHPQMAYQRRQHETLYATPQHHPQYSPLAYSYPYQQMHPQYHPSTPYYQHPMQSPNAQQYAYPPMPMSQYPMMHNPPAMPRPQYRLSPTSNTSSTRSNLLSPPPPPTRLPQSAPFVPRSRPTPPPAPPPVFRQMPYYPPLPWYSTAESDFPRSTPRKRRRPRAPLHATRKVELPGRTGEVDVENMQRASSSGDIGPSVAESSMAQGDPSETVTPVTSHAPSETESTQPTTPSSAMAPQALSQTSVDSTNVSAPNRPSRRNPIVPAIPFIPSLQKPHRMQSDHTASLGRNDASSARGNTVGDNTKPMTFDQLSISSEQHGSMVGQSNAFADESKVDVATSKAPPKSWADLVRDSQSSGNATITGGGAHILHANGMPMNRPEAVSDFLESFDLSATLAEVKIPFLKPRGLMNTGNMCYMNSVLQILVFCVPFSAFLTQVSSQFTFSFQSQTPLLDALILFLREFPIIDSAKSVDQLRLRLQAEELELYGDAFIPEFVYDAIRHLPKFSTMRRGHQQDAEEFLGFLLSELHEECLKLMRFAGADDTTAQVPPIQDPIAAEGKQPSPGDSDWLEVGPRQRAAVTRSSGIVVKETPITKIFSGHLRSELRVPGTKNSVTQESYQSLQLDIGSPQVTNIVDALRGLTRSEILHGEFNSPRGPGVPATKQVFIETLPPVLILHLKRFQYDNTGGTQKIWKRVGYPLDLDIPVELFPPHRRAGLLNHGAVPRYRLIGVVYHHGKNASGGHYTVDIRRQDGREWIRLDDTVIRRIRSEDVAGGGSEEDPKILAAALEQHKRDQTSSSNIFDRVREEEDERQKVEEGWNQVNGNRQTSPGGGSKKWSGIVNDAVTPSGGSSGKRTPVPPPAIKDNKVAYLLFYQKIAI